MLVIIPLLFQVSHVKPFMGKLPKIQINKQKRTSQVPNDKIKENKDECFQMHSNSTIRYKHNIWTVYLFVYILSTICVAFF